MRKTKDEGLIDEKSRFGGFQSFKWKALKL